MYMDKKTNATKKSIFQKCIFRYGAIPAKYFLRIFKSVTYLLKKI